MSSRLPIHESPTIRLAFSVPPAYRSSAGATSPACRRLRRPSELLADRGPGRRRRNEASTSSHRSRRRDAWRRSAVDAEGRRDERLSGECTEGMRMTGEALRPSGPLADAASRGRSRPHRYAHPAVRAAYSRPHQSAAVNGPYLALWRTGPFVAPPTLHQPSMPAMTHDVTERPSVRALHLLLPLALLAAAGCSVSDADERSHAGQTAGRRGRRRQGGMVAGRRSPR